MSVCPNFWLVLYKNIEDFISNLLFPTEFELLYSYKIKTLNLAGTVQFRSMD